MPHVKGDSKDTYRLFYREKMVLYYRLWAGTASPTYVPLPNKDLHCCRTLSNLQGSSAPCNLSLGLHWDDKNNTRRPRLPSHSVLHCNSYHYFNGTFIAKEKDLGQVYLWALNEILGKITCIKSLGEKKNSQQQDF